MAKRIRNMNDLEKLLQPVMREMVDNLTNEVYEVLNGFLKDYYTGWTPASYRRTKDFLYSAVKTEAKVQGGRCMASVYIDYDSMDNYVNATGFQVAEWANTGLHGGLEVRHKPHVWDDTMHHTVDNGSLLNHAVRYLRDKGFSVRT